MKKLIFLLLLIPIIGLAQEGGYRSLRTISARVTLLDLAGTGNKLVGVDNNGAVKNVAVDGTTITLINNVISAVPSINTSVQALSGTTVTWNLASGVNATLTTSGNTSITLSNLVAGNSGTIFITNPITAYYIKFVGRTCDVKGTNVTVDTSGILCSGGSKHDSFGWYYNGTTLQIHVALDYTRITW